MTYNETLKLMAVLKAAYPQYYRGMPRADADGVVALWQDMFQDEPEELVAVAVKVLIATDDKGFPPHIGAVREQIRKVRCGTDGEMTEQEAWTLVRKALSNGYYGYRKEFAKLPPVIQGVLGDAMQLHHWSQLETREVDTVVASNFMRSYAARAKHVREMERLPAPVLNLIKGLTEQMRMPEGEQQKRIGGEVI